MAILPTSLDSISCHQLSTCPILLLFPTHLRGPLGLVWPLGCRRQLYGNRSQVAI